MFSASLVSRALNIRCILLLQIHTVTRIQASARINPMVIPTTAPLDSLDEVADGWAVAVGDAEMNKLVDADPVCPAIGLVETVVLGIGLVVVLVTIV